MASVIAIPFHLFCTRYKMSLTLRDVAQRANVSPSTVSRVLNNYPHVDTATRAVVWQAAEELGYPLGNLRRQATASRSVLLLTRFQGATLSTETLAGIEKAITAGAQGVLREAGLIPRIQYLDLDTQRIDSEPDFAAAAGFIYLGGMVNRRFVSELVERDIPVVVAGAHVRPLPVNCVTADYRSGMEQAVTLLARSGRRRIALVNGPVSTSSSTEKYKGFRLGLNLHELEFDPARVVVSDFDPESGHERTSQLLAQAPELDAIVYADDYMAMGGIHALKKLGRRVPDDVAVTGFYDYPVARYTDPPLTSVHFDMQAMGAAAARRLCMLLDDPYQEPWIVGLPTDLVVRSST